MKKYHTDEDRQKAQRASRRKYYYANREREIARSRVNSKKWKEANPGRSHHKPFASRTEAEKQASKHTASVRTQKMRDFLGSVCLYYGCMNPDCKWDGPYTPEMLDFHHLRREDKAFCVSQGCSKSMAIIVAEINKCCVLCANCHRLETWGSVDCSNLPACNLTADGRVVGPC